MQITRQTAEPLRDLIVPVLSLTFYNRFSPRMNTKTLRTITCDGGNHMRMIFTKGAVAYFFWEGDAVLVLKRKTP
jgi:hypothetical protein